MQVIKLPSLTDSGHTALDQLYRMPGAQPSAPPASAFGSGGLNDRAAYPAWHGTGAQEPLLPPSSAPALPDI